MRSKGGLLSLVLFLFFSGQNLLFSQVPGFFMKEEAQKVSIPFYSSNSLIIIAVSINGSPSMNFLVDTGVRANILFSKKLGDALGLEYTRRLNLVGADGASSLMASVSPANDLDLGPVIGRLQSLLVLEEDFFELETVIGVPIYGIIGYEFFKFNPVKVDYDDGTLDFYRYNALKWRPIFYKKIHLAVEENKPYISAKVRQQDGSVIYPKLLIDTGANHGLLLNRETTEQITLPNLFLESELGQSLGGVLYGFIGRVDYLNFAGYRMNDVLTSYPEETPFSHVIKNTGRQGSLGSEVLGRSRIIFDYPRNRLLIKRGDNFYDPFEFDMSGMVLKKIPNDDNRIYISVVREDSPAQKEGLLPFDEILSVNKVPTFMWELSEINKLLRSEEGKEIQMEIRRYEGDNLKVFEDISVKFNLKKQI